MLALLVVVLAIEGMAAPLHAQAKEQAPLSTGAPRLAPEGIIRTVVLRFGHPYAVVAVATAPDGTDHAWDGIPAFSAWVAQPEEPA